MSSLLLPNRNFGASVDGLRFYLAVSSELTPKGSRPLLSLFLPSCVARLFLNSSWPLSSLLSPSCVVRKEPDDALTEHFLP